MNADGTANITKLFELYDQWREKNGRQSNDKPFKEPPKAYSFNRLNTKHHIGHAKEMGFKNPKEYEAAAVEFFNSDRGTLYYSEARKRYYRYEEKTGLFCVSMDGVVNTFNIYTKKKFDLIKRQDKLRE